MFDVTSPPATTASKNVVVSVLLAFTPFICGMSSLPTDYCCSIYNVPSKEKLNKIYLFNEGLLKHDSLEPDRSTRKLETEDDAEIVTTK